MVLLQTPERHFHAFVAFTPVHLFMRRTRHGYRANPLTGWQCCFASANPIQLLKNGLL